MNKSVIITFDGLEIDLDDLEGTEGTSFVYRKKDESGGNAFSFSPELEVKGAVFTLVYQKIINKPIPALESIKVRVFDACCADDDGNPLLLFDGKIEGSEVTWCEHPFCTATVTITEDTPESRAIACLKNTFPWDRLPKFDGSGISAGEDSFRAARYMAYCLDMKPNFLQEFILVIAIITRTATAPILFVVGLIVAVINVIISVINFLGGNIDPINFGGADDPNIFDEGLELVTLVDEFAVGCGFKHKSPFYHSYITNLCDICGLSLQSSLFDPGGALHNLTRLDAQRSRGFREPAKIEAAYTKNKPNLNGLQFLDELRNFNIDWRVAGGALIIERKDFFFGGTWIDIETLPAEQFIELCFDVDKEKPAAYGEYLYSKDGVDNTGDEVTQEWSDRVIDWNDPPNPAQVGLKQVRLFYSAAQFREDAARDRKCPLDKGFYKFFFPVLNNTTDVLLLEKGTSNFPKLLIWDGLSPQDDARVERISRDPGEPIFDYNFTMFIKENFIDASGTARDTLYQLLFFIDDPRYSGIQTRGYTLRVQETCDLLRSLDVDKVNRIPIGGTFFEATIDEINLDKDNKVIEVKGKV